MAKKKKRRTTALSARKPGRVTRLRAGRRRRRRGLSAMNIPGIGPVSLSNPYIGGIAGGVAAQFMKNLVPDNIFGTPNPADPTSFASIMAPFAKAVAIGVGALIVDKAAKKPMVAAGMVGAGTALALSKMNIPALSEGDNAYYANPALLSEGVYPDYTFIGDAAGLSSARMLSQRR